MRTDRIGYGVPTCPWETLDRSISKGSAQIQREIRMDRIRADRAMFLVFRTVRIRIKGHLCKEKMTYG